MQTLIYDLAGKIKLDKSHSFQQPTADELKKLNFKLEAALKDNVEIKNDIYRKNNLIPILSCI